MGFTIKDLGIELIDNETELVAYKGFDSDMTCRDFQYEEGKEYETENAAICKNGFHACLYPLDVLEYYPASKSIYHKVILSGHFSTQENDNTKICASKIKICEELTMQDLQKASQEFIRNHATDNSSNTRDRGSSSNTEKCSWSSNTGIFSISSNTGHSSSSSNMGEYGISSNTGSNSSSSNTAYGSSSSNTGQCSLSSNTGDYSSSSNTGAFSISSNTGDYSSSSNVGYDGLSSSTGRNSISSSTGLNSVSLNTGLNSISSSTGYHSSSSNTGDFSITSNTGAFGSVSVGGKCSVGVAWGFYSRAKGVIGSTLVLIYYEPTDKFVTDMRQVSNDEREKYVIMLDQDKKLYRYYQFNKSETIVIDGEKYKENTWYIFNDDGEIVEWDINNYPESYIGRWRD